MTTLEKINQYVIDAAEKVAEKTEDGTEVILSVQVALLKEILVELIEQGEQQRRWHDESA